MGVKKAVKKAVGKAKAAVSTKATPENIKKLKESIEKHRREGKYEHFQSVADEDIE